MKDAINPNHYKTQSGIECIEIAEALGYCLGNAFKYAWRAGQKDNITQDLEKCQWYLKRASLTDEDILLEQGSSLRLSLARDKLLQYLTQETLHHYPQRPALLRVIASGRLSSACLLVEEALEYLASSDFLKVGGSE